ncbi:LPXTG cell wall anchor domain-containing protein [Microbacterium wangchenii]|uniref:LPXTG cell wall anchor domain-containing protein n=2 Tax=Microbacteriaceae TaxID=85023 RepID=A0ABX5SP27_9MICO|nr:LPXTG cell wall anchor domain-containing protein [Microbacterium wangchenii]TXK08998.1 LPXTG cell wall anchor domain-containing protein [Microbacterium wangchenii]
MHSPALPRARRTVMALAMAVVATLLASAVSALPAAAESRDDIASYAPPGTINVARAAAASVSNSEAAWPADKLVDGNPGISGINLWVAADTGVDAGGWAQLDFAEPEPIERVVVFPRGDLYGAYFPIDYTVTLLGDGGESVWSTRVTHPDQWTIVSEPDVIDLEAPVTASALRLDVTKRSAREGGILQLAEIAAFAEGVASEPEEPEEPQGPENLARGAVAVASSSYEMPGETWAAALAVDGSRGTGWSTNPYDRVQDPAAPATLTLDLACTVDVTSLVVAPREKAFPRDYRLQVSADGDAWSTVATSTGNPGVQPTAQEFALANPTAARFVRLQVDVRNGPSGIDGYLAQISELEVYGERNACVIQQKPALLLPPGATDAHWFSVVGPQPEISVASSDPSVVTVAADGTVTAVAVGTSTVTLTAGDTTLSLPVEVSDDIERIGDEFAITAFWPPTIDYVGDEHYDNLAEAGITIVQNNQIETSARHVNLEMARLAHERDMQIIVQDSTAGSLATMSADEVKEWVNTYRNVPGVGGLYLIDEPSNAVAYATAFNAVREEAPELYPHLNFFPYFYYGGEAGNDKAMQDWIDATNGRSIDDRDYLMYDMYPFREGDTNLEGMFTNLNTVRELGLENSVKTAMYLQAVGIPGNLRRPVPAEIRYEANVAMAYGYKQLSYFTWWTPTNRGEPFTDAIMTADGRKTDLYEPVKQLNSEIQALGDTLMRLDAEQVYLSGTAYGQPTVPADFFVQSEGDGDLVLSRMIDRESGEEYLFVVNNSFTAEQSMELSFDETIGALREVSREDGSLGAPIELDGQTLTRTLSASEGVLYQVADATDPEDPAEPTDPTAPADPTAPPAPVDPGADPAAGDQVGGDWANVTLSNGGRVERGDTLSVTLTELQPGQQVAATLFSEPITVTGIPAANASGTVTFSVPVPADFAVGAHTLAITAAGLPQINVGVTVLAAGALAVTGGQSPWAFALAGALLLVAGGLVYVLRRRSRVA